jgi:hypothetical protein
MIIMIIFIIAISVLVLNCIKFNNFTHYTNYRINSILDVDNSTNVYINSNKNYLSTVYKYIKNRIILKINLNKEERQQFMINIVNDNEYSVTISINQNGKIYFLSANKYSDISLINNNDILSTQYNFIKNINNVPINYNCPKSLCDIVSIGKNNTKVSHLCYPYGTEFMCGGSFFTLIKVLPTFYIIRSDVWNTYLYYNKNGFIHHKNISYNKLVKNIKKAITYPNFIYSLNYIFQIESSIKSISFDDYIQLESYTTDSITKDNQVYSKNI